MHKTVYHEKYTIHDHKNWQDNWEIIRGEAFAMSPSPSYHHQSINLKVARQLDELLENCPHCHAVIELDVTFSEDTVVRPDSMVICYQPEAHLNKAPTLVFEVISPSTARRDELLKFELYEKEAVKYYAMAYPDSHKVKLFELIDFKYRKIADFSDENFTFDLGKCSIDFDFARLWRKK